MAAGAGDTPPGELGALKDAIKEVGPLGTAISAVVGVGVVYAIGGMVSILRLRQAGLPVEQGLDVMPREQLLVVGAREVILVLVLSLVLFLILTKVKAPWSYVTMLALCLVALVLAPITLSGFAWPVAILLVLGLWHIHQKRGSYLALLAIPVVVLVAVAFRYDDPPARFYAGNVWNDEEPYGECRFDRTDELRVQASRCGYYLGITDDNVYIGIPTSKSERREIIGLPTRTVKRVMLTEFPSCPDPGETEPPVRGCTLAPRLSLLGHYLRWRGWGEISCNPLECWVGNTNHGSRVFG